MGSMKLQAIEPSDHPVINATLELMRQVIFDMATSGESIGALAVEMDRDSIDITYRMGLHGDALAKCEVMMFLTEGRALELVDMIRSARSGRVFRSEKHVAFSDN